MHACQLQSRHVRRILLASGAALVLAPWLYSSTVAIPDGVCDTVTFAGEGWDPAVSGSIIAFEAGHWLYYHDVETGVTVDLGVSGDTPELSGSILAFVTREYYAGDLNGDGDTYDKVLRYCDIATGEVTNTGIEATAPWVSGSTIAFIWREGNRRKPGYLDILTGAVTYLDVHIGPYYSESGVSVSGSTLTYSRRETYVGDLNGDGDMNDDVIHYYDIDTHVEVNTGLSGKGPNVSGSIIVFATSEETDLNGDGDTADHLVRYYDMDTGVVANAPLDESWDPEISGNVILYYAFELQSNQDLNGDGVIDGAIVTVYYDISTNILTSTRIDSWYIGISGSLIAMMGGEGSNNGYCDWNGDGDTADRVVVYKYIETTVGVPELAALLDEYLADGSIANPGIAEALRALVVQAQASADKGNSVAAANKLTAFTNLVLAQSGIHITVAAAETIVGVALDVIDGL